MSEKSSPANEAALVCAARQGDKGSLQALLARHWLWLKGLIYSILRDSEATEDALQDVCVLVLNKIGGLREPERFRPWLARLARNVALSQRAQQSRRPGPLGEDTPAAAGPSVSDVLDRQEQSRRILEGVHALPDKYGEVFVMKYVQELSYGEIAEILDIPVTTVQIRLVRARRMIYNRLTGLPNNKVPRT